MKEGREDEVGRRRSRIKRCGGGGSGGQKIEINIVCARLFICVRAMRTVRVYIG